MKDNLAEINDIDYSNDPISFYSTSSTLESIKTLCALIEDPVFDEMSANEFLEIANIVGIASLGTVADYPDPLLYLTKTIYPGCYISISDIITAESISKGQSKLLAPGLNQEINNCIPVFSNKKVYDFLRKYAPSILELSSGIGMRRVLADIPKTFEANVLSGLWKMVGIVKGNEKYEINIKSLIELIRTMVIVAGNHNEDVIEIMKNQFKNENCKKLGLYLNDYGIYQLLPVLNKLAVQNMLSKEELQKFMRSIYRFEVYKSVRKNIRKNENQKDYIEKTMNEALGIDFDKYGTKLPEMFEKKLNPEFCDTFIINKEVISQFKKQIGWIENIPYAYCLFEAAQKPDPLNEIKNMPQFTEEKKKEYFGINYDFNKFIIFNIVQSLFYKEKIDRENENDKVMKIIDSNDEAEVDKFLKEQTKHIYSSKYNIENQKQIKLQNDIITKELVEKLKNTQNLQEFNDLMRKGITKGYLTHIIKDESTKGYNELKNILLNEKEEVPLRFEKIRNILSGTDEKGEVLWNKGNAVRNKRSHYQKFIEKQKGNEDILNILNMTYRDLYTNYYLKSTKENSLDNSYEAHKEKILSLNGKEYLEIFIKNAENFVEFFFKTKNRKSKKTKEVDTINIPIVNELAETVDTLNEKNKEVIGEQIMKTNDVEMISVSTQTDLCDINSKLISFL